MFLPLTPSTIGGQPLIVGPVIPQKGLDYGDIPNQYLRQFKTSKGYKPSNVKDTKEKDYNGPPLQLEHWLKEGLVLKQLEEDINSQMNTELASVNDPSELLNKQDSYIHQYPKDVFNLQMARASHDAVYPTIKGNYDIWQKTSGDLKVSNEIALIPNKKNQLLPGIAVSQREIDFGIPHFMTEEESVGIDFAQTGVYEDKLGSIQYSPFRPSAVYNDVAGQAITKSTKTLEEAKTSLSSKFRDNKPIIGSETIKAINNGTATKEQQYEYMLFYTGETNKYALGNAISNIWSTLTPDEKAAAQKEFLFAFAYDSNDPNLYIPKIDENGNVVKEKPGTEEERTVYEPLYDKGIMDKIIREEDLSDEEYSDYNETIKRYLANRTISMTNTYRIEKGQYQALNLDQGKIPGGGGGDTYQDKMNTEWYYNNWENFVAMGGTKDLEIVPLFFEDKTKLGTYKLNTGPAYITQARYSDLWNKDDAALFDEKDKLTRKKYVGDLLGGTYVFHPESGAIINPKRNNDNYIFLEWNDAIGFFSENNSPTKTGIYDWKVTKWMNPKTLKEEDVTTLQSQRSARIAIKKKEFEDNVKIPYIKNEDAVSMTYDNWFRKQQTDGIISPMADPVLWAKEHFKIYVDNSMDSYENDQGGLTEFGISRGEPSNIYFVYSPDGKTMPEDPEDALKYTKISTEDMKQILDGTYSVNVKIPQTKLYPVKELPKKIKEKIATYNDKQGWYEMGIWTPYSRINMGDVGNKTGTPYNVDVSKKIGVTLSGESMTVDENGNPVINIFNNEKSSTYGGIHDTTNTDTTRVLTYPGGSE